MGLSDGPNMNLLSLSWANCFTETVTFVIEGRYIKKLLQHHDRINGELGILEREAGPTCGDRRVVDKVVISPPT